MGREEGGEFGMGSTCIPVEDSFILFESFTCNDSITHNITSVFLFFFFLNFIFKLYIIALVLPNIKMNQPQVYMCSPS